MPDRVNLENLRNAFVYYCAMAERLGFTTTNWHLSIGSRPQGIRYKVGVKGHAAAQKLPAAGDDGSIGRTRGEAYDTLQTAAQTMEAVAQQMGLCD